jgi:hypothetical protein
MTRFTRRTLCQLLPILMAVWCGGCGGGGEGATVSGTVTLDGTPIEDGSISFSPEGEGSSAGTKIVKGKYSAKNVTTGKNRVHIDAAVPGKKPTREERAKGGVTAPENPVTKAQGNDQEVEIAPGSQTKDFPLTKAGS